MAYTDWIEIVDSTILNKKKLSILEFGLGEGTRYLLDNFKQVYSYELNDNNYPELINWYHQAVKEFSSYTNWNNEVVWYNDIGFVDYNPDLPVGLTNRIDELFKQYKFEVVFIDGVGHCRGDVANYILNTHYPSYVIIHDTNFAYEQDGYHRINLPDLYDTVKYTVGEGTHIFVKK